MTILSNEYLSEECNGNLKECDRKRAAIGSHLSSLLKQVRIKGYLFRTITSRECLIEESLCEEDIDVLTEIVQNRFPFMYGTIAYDPILMSETELQGFEKSFNLVRTRTY